MEGKNEIYLKIIRGAELSEQEKAYIQKEKESDPELGLLLVELRHMHGEASEIPKVFLDEEKAWKRFKENAAPQKVRKAVKFMAMWWKYAAVFVGLMVIGYGIYSNGGPEALKSKDPASADQIVLQLADGSTVVLDEKESFSITGTDGQKIGQLQQDELHYGGTDVEMGKEQFNRLTVPFGKRLKIFLSDGSRVYVNSGTTIRYPVVFGKEGNRQIFLKEGEAYFDVARDESRPFVVNTSRMNVRVLGTEFNVSAYAEDEAVRTVLVSGSVEVSAPGQAFSEQGSTKLSPGEMASIVKSNDLMDIESVETLNYTAWKDDRLVFIDEPFHEIAKKIERSYGVKVFNHFDALDTARFYGDFILSKESVEDVLKVFMVSRTFDYSIKGNRITITEAKE